MKTLLAITSGVLIGAGLLTLLISTMLLLDHDVRSETGDYACRTSDGTQECSYTRDSPAAATLRGARTNAVNQLGATMALTGALLAVGAVVAGRSTRRDQPIAVAPAAPVSALQPVHPAHPAFPHRPAQ